MYAAFFLRIVPGKRIDPLGGPLPRESSLSLPDAGDNASSPLEILGDLRRVVG